MIIKHARPILEESGPRSAYCAACKAVTLFTPMQCGARVFWLCENELLAGEPHMIGRPSLKLRGFPIMRGVWKCQVRKGALWQCEISHDGHVCAGKLTAHHVVPREHAPTMSMDLANGMCLCEAAHQRLHADWRYEVEAWRNFQEFRPPDAAFLMHDERTSSYMCRVAMLEREYDQDPAGDISAPRLCGTKMMALLIGAR